MTKSMRQQQHQVLKMLSPSFDRAGAAQDIQLAALFIEFRNLNALFPILTLQMDVLYSTQCLPPSDCPRGPRRFQGPSYEGFSLSELPRNALPQKDKNQWIFQVRT